MAAVEIWVPIIGTYGDENDGPRADVPVEVHYISDEGFPHDFLSLGTPHERLRFDICRIIIDDKDRDACKATEIPEGLIEEDVKLTIAMLRCKRDHLPPTKAEMDAAEACVDALPGLSLGGTDRKQKISDVLEQIERRGGMTIARANAIAAKHDLPALGR